MSAGVTALRQKNVGAAHRPRLETRGQATLRVRRCPSHSSHGLCGGGSDGNASTDLRTASRLNERDERSRLAHADVLVASGALAAAAEPGTIRRRPSPGIGRGALAARQARAGAWRRRRRAIVRARRDEPLVAGSARLYTIVGQAHHAQFNVDAPRQDRTGAARIVPKTETHT